MACEICARQETNRINFGAQVTIMLCNDCMAVAKRAEELHSGAASCMEKEEIIKRIAAKREELLA